MLEHFLHQLALDLELDPVFSKDKEGQFLVPLNDQLKISVKALDPGVLLRSTPGSCPTLKKEELFIWLMKANLLGQGTGESVLGMDEEEKFITLSLFLPYEMNYREFKDSLEEFANYTDYWKEELIKYQKEAESSIL